MHSVYSFFFSIVCYLIANRNRILVARQQCLWSCGPSSLSILRRFRTKHMCSIWSSPSRWSCARDKKKTVNAALTNTNLSFVYAKRVKPVFHRVRKLYFLRFGFFFHRLHYELESGFSCFRTARHYEILFLVIQCSNAGIRWFWFIFWICQCAYLNRRNRFDREFHNWHVRWQLRWDQLRYSIIIFFLVKCWNWIENKMWIARWISDIWRVFTNHNWLV